MHPTSVRCGRCGYAVPVGGSRCIACRARLGRRRARSTDTLATPNTGPAAAEAWARRPTPEPEGPLEVGDLGSYRDVGSLATNLETLLGGGLFVLTALAATLCARLVGAVGFDDPFDLADQTWWDLLGALGRALGVVGAGAVIVLAVQGGAWMLRVVDNTEALRYTPTGWRGPLQRTILLAAAAMAGGVAAANQYDATSIESMRIAIGLGTLAALAGRSALLELRRAVAIITVAELEQVEVRARREIASHPRPKGRLPSADPFDLPRLQARERQLHA